MTRVEINRHNLIEQIRSHFPDLEDSYQRELEKWSGEEDMPSNYIVVGNVLQPRFTQELIKLLPSQFLRRCTDFFEEVCVDGDVEAINVISFREPAQNFGAIFLRGLYSGRDCDRNGPKQGQYPSPLLPRIGKAQERSLLQETATVRSMILQPWPVRSDSGAV
jgi:hypothetical protein